MLLKDKPWDFGQSNNIRKWAFEGPYFDWDFHENPEKFNFHVY